MILVSLCITCILFGTNNKHPNRLTTIGLFANHRFFQSAKNNISWNQLRPLPLLPSLLASGKPVPTRCFNPFKKSAPPGYWQGKKKEMEQCAAALLGLEKPKPFLLAHFESISKKFNVDEEMERQNKIGFCIHTDTDVLLCGLSSEYSKQALEAIAHRRDATSVLRDANLMIPIVEYQAKKQSTTFTVKDDYTTRAGYSTNQMAAIPTNYSKKYLIDSIARGGLAQQHFKKRSTITNEMNIISTRIPILTKMVEEAEKISRPYLENWRSINRPRPTEGFQQNNTFVRCPLTVENSLPPRANMNLSKFTSWETSLRAIEEEMMVSIFGMLPNVIWATILAKVMERFEEKIGDIDVPAFERWKRSGMKGPPPKLGFPSKGCASRLLPKGAAGISPTKPMHDDNNGLISLGCWTSLTKSDSEVDLVFIVDGKEVSIRVTALRSVLFMGYIPHETRSVDEKKPATKARLHHSSFVKL